MTTIYSDWCSHLRIDETTVVFWDYAKCHTTECRVQYLEVPVVNVCIANTIIESYAASTSLYSTTSMFIANNL